MPLLKLTVADLPLDDHDPVTRTSWINTDHIETATGHITWHELDPVLWLELAMTSGAIHYALVGPLAITDIAVAADHAINQMLRNDAHAHPLQAP